MPQQSCEDIRAQVSVSGLLERPHAKMKRVTCIEDLCVGRCSDCRENVYALIMSNGVAKVEHRACPCCCKQDGKNEISVTTYSDNDEEDLLLMRAIWPDINWELEKVSIPKEINFDTNLVSR